MKCQYCETENNPSDKTCRHCGKPLPVTSANTDRPIRFRKCRKCGTEHKAGFCPMCGRWNGPPPGGVIFIGVLSIVNSAIILLTGLYILLLTDKMKIDAIGLSMAIVVSALACGNLVVAINLLRLKQWAVIVYRVILISGIAGTVAMFLIGLVRGFSLFNLISTLTSIAWGVFLLSYLGSKAYLFSNQTPRTAREKTQRRCVHCGNEELTSFDRICPKCKKELA
jgi:hypothetical protein